MLACLSLSALLPSLNTSIANVGLPVLARFFEASFQQVQWVVLGYLLAITTVMVGAGRLSDTLGRRRVLLAGIGVFTGASLLYGAAPSLGVLIAARTAQGMGAAVMMAVSVALIGESVPKARVGSAMGLLGTMPALGTTLGPSIGGILISGIGWRAIFLVNLPLGTLNLYLAHRFLPSSSAERKEMPTRVDSFGTVLLGLTLAAYALAMTMGRGQFEAVNIVLLLAAGRSRTLCEDGGLSRVATGGPAHLPESGAESESCHERDGVDRDDVHAGGRAVLSFPGDRAGCGRGRHRDVGGAAHGRAGWCSVRPHGGPLWTAVHSNRRAACDAGWLPDAVDHAIHGWSVGLRRRHCCRHGGLCAVSGRQQHSGHGGGWTGSARRRIWRAQPIEESRTGDRRLRDGCRVRTGFGRL